MLQKFTIQLLLVAGGCFLCADAIPQARIRIDSAVINITQGAVLLVDNPDPAAIIRSGGGYIKSEGAANRVAWTIGTASQQYSIPFGTASDYLPLSFTTTGGNPTTGQLVVSTYATSSWKNSDELPPGISNLNSGTIDNSARVIDRFWQLHPQAYSINPTLTNLRFRYSNAELAAPNTIVPSQLMAQRWNSTGNTWSDYLPVSFVNTVNREVTVPSIPGSQLYNWWTLVDASSPLPVTLLYFSASANNEEVVTRWSTASEQNTDHFEVWKSSDGNHFDYCGSVTAAGNSSGLRAYLFDDLFPLPGVSWYRLKTVDRDGRYNWSASVMLRNNANGPSVFPNPAHEIVYLQLPNTLLNSRPMVVLSDEKGRFIKTLIAQSAIQPVVLSNLAAGIYLLTISNSHQTQTLRFIKN